MQRKTDARGRFGAARHAGSATVPEQQKGKRAGKEGLPGAGRPLIFLSLPGTSSVERESAQDAVQIPIKVIAVAAVVEDETAFKLPREEVIGFALADPLRNDYLGDFCRGELQVAESGWEEPIGIKRILRDEAGVAEFCGIGGIHIGPH